MFYNGDNGLILLFIILLCVYIWNGRIAAARCTSHKLKFIINIKKWFMVNDESSVLRSERFLLVLWYCMSRRILRPWEWKFEGCMRYTLNLWWCSCNIYNIYCSSGVYVMFKRLFKGLSGVRVVGKTGKSGWVERCGWVVGWFYFYIYIYARIIAAIYQKFLYSILCIFIQPEILKFETLRGTNSK